MPEPADGDYVAAYAEAHETLYGYRNDGREIEIVAVRVEVIGRTVEPEPASSRVPTRQLTPERTIPVCFAAQSMPTGIFDPPTTPR